MQFPKIKNSLAVSLIVSSCAVSGAALAQASTSPAPAYIPPRVDIAVKRSVVAQATPVVEPAQKSPLHYVVVSGDTLSGISQKFYRDGGDYPAIAKANSLDNPNLIYPEQALVIPPKGQEPAPPAPKVSPEHGSTSRPAHHAVPKSLSHKSPKHHYSSTRPHPHRFSIPFRATSGSPRAIAHGMVSSSDFACLDYVISHESGWSVTATNASSGAYGLGQALPGSKMASAGADWRTNPATQLRWVIGYMDSRYSSICGAASYWKSHLWY